MGDMENTEETPEDQPAALISPFSTNVKFPLDLPGGYLDASGVLHKAITLRPTTGVEEDILVDDGRTEVNKMRDVLANCLVKLGPYDVATAKVGDVYKVLDGMFATDRAFAQIVLRCISVPEGDKIRFTQHCLQKMCGKDWNNVLDLSTFPVKPIVEAKAEYDFVLPQSGDKVKFRLLHASDDQLISELQTRYPTQLVSAIMWLHMVSINGKKVPAPRDLQKMSSFDRASLRKVMEQANGGVDLSYSAQCPKCRNVVPGALRLDSSFFLLSSGSPD